MNAWQRRVFIAIDEWAGVALLCWLRYTGDPLFTRVFWSWMIATYFIAYPLHWIESWREYVAVQERIVEGEVVDDAHGTEGA